MEDRGVVYYNSGTGCAVRLLVSLTSLRRHYSGPILILSEGEESHRLCEKIALAVSADFRRWDSGVAPGANRHFLAKTRLHLGTPFKVCVALDSDTLVLGQIHELFQLASASDFCLAQFSNWRSDGRIIAKRIRKWIGFAGVEVELALQFGPAINTGVIAFRKDATLFDDWYRLALRGREFFIPDEVACQILLPHHPHHVLSSKWNCSCRYDDPGAPDTRIVHFHGRKHCRPGLPFHGSQWIAEFQTVCRDNIADVTQWMPAGDRTLGRFLRSQVCKAQPIALAPKLDVRSPIRTAIATAPELRIVLGARKTAYEGWLSTDRDTLDVRKRSDWQDLIGDAIIHRLLAEHVWEHLTWAEMQIANDLAFEFLNAGGCLRIAVPDGYHPDSNYIAQVTTGGSGRSAYDHKQLLNFQTLGDALILAGFRIDLLEYWDASGEFHYRPWHLEEGYIKRSAFNDRRNRKGKLVYTSLIIDAWKP